MGGSGRGGEEGGDDEASTLTLTSGSIMDDTNIHQYNVLKLEIDKQPSNSIQG
jgi:hypothetical protein